MKDYLEFNARQEQYKESVKWADLELQERREAYVDQQLKLYDNAHLMKEEDTVWGWSPLYQTFLRDFPKIGPQRPWRHTEEEWVHIVEALQVEGAKEPMTLELECPHIVRALKLYSRVSSGRNTPLAHPERGMTRHNVLGIARDSYESMRLCVAAQDVVDCGWVLFPCVSSAGVSSVLDCRRDFLGLVGYEGTEQEAVLRQIETFIVRVARRSIVDMVRKGNTEELATMWYKKKFDGLPRPHCDQVLQNIFYCNTNFID